MNLDSEHSHVQPNGPPAPDSVASEFASEADLATSTVVPARRWTYSRFATIAVAAVVLVSASVVVGLSGTPPADASLGVESDPLGAEVRIDGTLRGKTPLALTLSPGTHTVVIGNSLKERRITLAPAERASIYHIHDLVAPVTAPSEPSLASARLSVVTEPAGGRITIDGVDRGVAPLVVRDLAPGEHRVVVRSEGAVVYQQTVRLEAGTTSTVLMGASSAAAGGWLAVKVPLRLQIHEAGRLVGATDTERVMLPAGDHQLLFSDDQTGLRMARAVRITPGATTNVTLQVPLAPVNLNAIPWAEVWLGNERLGETPIANYMLPLGSHPIELRHPQLGTRRVTMLVSLNGPNRLAVNMREQ